MLVYGHRGAAGEAPENTVAGVRHLIALGIHRLEIDLRLSADAELVVLHDRSLRRTGRTPGPVTSLSAAALAARTAPTGAPVPTLLELLTACPELTHLQLEIKPAAPAQLQPLAQRLAATLSAVGAPLERYCATSSDPRVLATVRHVIPGLPTGLVLTRQRDCALIPRLGCTLACVHFPLVNRRLMNRLRRLAVSVSAWTVNTRDEFCRLQRLGCDSVITDYPSRFSPRTTPGTATLPLRSP